MTQNKKNVDNIMEELRNGSKETILELIAENQQLRENIEKVTRENLFATANCCMYIREKCELKARVEELEEKIDDQRVRILKLENELEDTEAQYLLSPEEIGLCERLDELCEENQQLKDRVEKLEKMKPTCSYALSDAPYYQCQARKMVEQKEIENQQLKDRLAELEKFIIEDVPHKYQKRLLNQS